MKKNPNNYTGQQWNYQYRKYLKYCRSNLINDNNIMTFIIFKNKTLIDYAFSAKSVQAYQERMYS